MHIPRPESVVLTPLHRSESRSGFAGQGRLALDRDARGDARRRLTYDELADASSRFAEVLAGLGVGKGDQAAAE